MSLKSLNTRIDKIPDPDLSRLRQQQLYEKLKPLPYEQREELRQNLRCDPRNRPSRNRLQNRGRVTR